MTKRFQEGDNDDDDYVPSTRTLFGKAPFGATAGAPPLAFEDEHIYAHFRELHRLGLLQSGVPRSWRALCGKHHYLSAPDERASAVYDATYTVPYVDESTGLAIARSDVVRLSDARCYSRSSVRNWLLQQLRDANGRWPRGVPAKAPSGAALSAADLHLLRLEPALFRYLPPNQGGESRARRHSLAAAAAAAAAASAAAAEM